MKKDNYSLCSLCKNKLISMDYKNHDKSTLKKYAFILLAVCVVAIAFGGYIFKSNQILEDTQYKLLRLQAINNGLLKADKDAIQDFTRILLSDGWYGVPIFSGTGTFSRLFSELTTYVQVDERNLFIEQIKTADKNLSKLENDIDKLYIEKNLSEAQAIFSGDDYAYWKEEYYTSVEQIINITLNDLNALLQKQHDQTNYAIAMLLILLPILFVSYKTTRKLNNRSAQLTDNLIVSQEQFELAVHGSQDGMWDWIDINEDYMWWSSRGYELLGYEAGEIESSRSSFKKLLHPDDIDKWVNAHKLHIEKKIPYNFECRLQRKSGEYRWFNSRGQVIWGDNGQPLRMVGSLRDIHDQKETAKELKDSRDKLRNLVLHKQKVQDEERLNIAREIHDEFGQSLTALNMDIAWLNNKIQNGKKEQRERVRSMAVLVNDMIKSVQQLSGRLRPKLLDDFGLRAAVEWGLSDFQKRSGISCRLQANFKKEITNRQITSALFNIFQECLTNVKRHAEATQVIVSISNMNNKVKLQIQDNGKGINEYQINNPRSFGLIGMAERIHMLKGSFDINGIEKKGTTIKVEIPLNHKNR